MIEENEFYVVYVCEQCSMFHRSQKEQASAGLLWTKREYCQHCKAYRIFYRDGAYSIAIPKNTKKARKQSVYLFKADKGLYKIGISYDPKRRLGELLAGPVLIEYVWAQEFDDAKAVEAALHNYFSDKHVRREWFALEPADVAYIVAQPGGENGK